MLLLDTIVSLNVKCLSFTTSGLAVWLSSITWLKATSVTLLSASLGDDSTEEAASRVAEAEKGSTDVLGYAHSLESLQIGVRPMTDCVSKEFVLKVRHCSSWPICIESSF
jgi:hypothetical protein